MSDQTTQVKVRFDGLMNSIAIFKDLRYNTTQQPIKSSPSFGMCQFSMSKSDGSKSNSFLSLLFIKTLSYTFFHKSANHKCLTIKQRKRKAGFTLGSEALLLLLWLGFTIIHNLTHSWVLILGFNYMYTCKCKWSKEAGNFAVRGFNEWMLHFKLVSRFIAYA